MSYYGYAPYVSVGQKNQMAQRAIDSARRAGKPFNPVPAFRGKAALTFWGESWNRNLESCREFSFRLPKGLSYAKSGFVLDLSIAAGSVKAKVMGSEAYDVEITIAALAPTVWSNLKTACSGEIGSLIDLLQGKLGAGAMKLVCQQKTGLFPSANDIRVSCTCPDYMEVCKHAAAAFYGIARRLDEHPESLFVLRGVDATELAVPNAQALLAAQPSIGAKALAADDMDMGALFDLDFEEPDSPKELAAPTANSAQTPPLQRKSLRGSAEKHAAQRTASQNGLASPPVAAKITARKTNGQITGTGRGAMPGEPVAKITAGNQTRATAFSAPLIKRPPKAPTLAVRTVGARPKQ